MRRTNARKFGRIRKVRKALMRSLAYALISKGKIETTEAKAKSLRPFVEKLITEAKLAQGVIPELLKPLSAEVMAQRWPSLN